MISPGIPSLIDTTITTNPLIPADAAERFFDESCTAFEKAAQSSPYSERWLEIAGQIVRIRLAGTTLEPILLPALAHAVIADPERTPDLTIYAFDMHSTGVNMPTPAWSVNAFATPENLFGTDNASYFAVYNSNLGILNMLDVAGGRAFFWMRDGRLHPPHDMSSPFRLLMFWWMRTHGIQFVHGAAVGKAGAGLLLVGKGGSGKSSSALACLEAGWQYAGDDYVMFGLEPTPTVYNLYQSAKLKVDHLHDNFAGFTGTIHDYTQPDRQDKAIMLLQERFPGQLVHSIPLRAIVYPRVTGIHHPRLHKIDAKNSLAGLVPSTVQQLQCVRPQDFKAMTALVQALPGYALELGGNVQEIPDVLRELIT
jgi:hypothetical protein